MNLFFFSLASSWASAACLFLHLDPELIPQPVYGLPQAVLRQTGLKLLHDLGDEDFGDPGTRSLGQFEGVAQLLNGTAADAASTAPMTISTMKLWKKKEQDN